MKQIKLIDYYGIKNFHEIINLSLIVMCSNLFSEVSYISSTSTYLNLNKLLREYNCKYSNISFHQCKTYEKDTSVGALFRTIYGFFISLFIYLFSKSKTVLLYVYTNPLSLPLILILNIFLRKKIIFTMHGELELQNHKISFRKPSYYYKILYSISLKYLIKLSPAYLLLLGESIKKNLCLKYPNLESHIITINHPYFFRDYKLSKPTTKHIPLIIGTIGTMKKEKGSDNLIKLSQLLDKEIKEKKIILQSIGKVEIENYSSYKNINWIGGAEMLSREEFEKQIEQLDYILYLYPINSYKLTASGAIMDALKLQKPIISLENDFFNELLKDHAIGYLKKSVEDLAEIIKRIITQTAEKNFSENFQFIREQVSIPYNTSILQKEFVSKKIL